MMMNELTLKDNSKVEEGELRKIGKLSEQIVNKTLEHLEGEGVFLFPDAIRDAEDIEKKQIILKHTDGEYRTSNVMGFLGSGNDHLIIQSRFATEEKDYFFQYLLEKVLNIPTIVNLPTTSSKTKSHHYDFLLFMFPAYLKSALRKGLFRTYVQNIYNDKNVKGSIDIARHIRQNSPFIGNIAYNQREISDDNNMTQLIRHTIEYIKTKPLGTKLLLPVKQEVKSIIEATGRYNYYNRRKIVTYNSKNPMRHAFYRLIS